MKRKLISLNLFVLAFFCSGLDAQTPTPSARPRRPSAQAAASPAPRTTAAPSAPAQVKPAPINPEARTQAPAKSKAMIVSPRAPSADIEKRRKKVDIKPLAIAAKQEFLAGKTAGASVTLSMEHMHNTSGIEASFVLNSALRVSPWGAWPNGSDSSPDAGVYLFITPKAAGQMFLVDIRAFNDLGDAILKGFTVNGEPVNSSSLTPNHLVFVLTASSTDEIMTIIGANHTWGFDGCEITLLK